ncbi:exocyst subunit exo70 family protein C1 [Rhynchospora pubera]|uniref:Exocyst subunit Exo70 family protein n=1 Tax=Rhynchospora pubera TaxID=906938 RepID=A0AAV8DBV9_9POAL|nr:exocyst subunit exo70 family protein C1 [Rhynchospora pubera]
MKNTDRPLIPQKSNSFSFVGHKKELQRNLSLGFFDSNSDEKKTAEFLKDKINDGDISNKSENDANNGNADNKGEPRQAVNFATLLQDIDLFLATLTDPEMTELPELPEPIIRKFLDVVDLIVANCSGDEPWVPEDDDHPILATIDRVAIINAEITKHYSEPKYTQTINRSGSVLHRCMVFLEAEFHLLLLEDHNANLSCIIPTEETEGEPEKPSLPYTPEVAEQLRGIASSMISAGYVTECCQAFSTARHNAFHSIISSLGYERSSIDDIVRMSWEILEGQIPKWIKSCRQAINEVIQCERELVEKVFSCNPKFSSEFFESMAREAVIYHLTFPQAVVMTTQSTEKLFKVLDMYETLKELEHLIGSLLPNEREAGDNLSSSYNFDLKSEVRTARSHLGESAVMIFCDLEKSIKADSSRTAMPGGAVHPLTRYVMNYIKLACEYKGTMEHIFKAHYKPAHHTDNTTDDNDNPFAAQLIKLMDLLNENIEEKSKLYKDASLSCIFLMNNGSYMGQKIKGSEGISTSLGASWARKRFSELRQYHKNYQRETWSKVLGCLKDDGITVKGHVQKPVLKERFKSFNAIFEDVHRTQSAWVVSDEQLKSELKISVSAVLVPAYRSFKGRYEHHFSAGRQTEKYIRFSPDDLEKYIEDLFEGTPMSMPRRR